MTALAEALLAAQRSAIGAASKAFVAGHLNEAELLELLDEIGCRDAADQGYLLASLHVLERFGAPAPKATQAEPKPENEPATDGQWKYLRDLADRAQTTAPDGPLTKAQASTVIEQLKAGTYNPDEWTVPF